MVTSSRHLGLDNIKGILIIFVVLGHFLELCPDNSWKNPVYLGIYSFHMPAFLFFSGFFGKYSLPRLRFLVILYCIFQFLYSLFAAFILHTPSVLSPQKILTTPYWLMWYLAVLIYWYLLLPWWSRHKTPTKLIFLGISISLSLLAGYCKQIGYSYSLSRFLVFLPFFLAGEITGSNQKPISNIFCAVCSKQKNCLLVISILSVTLSMFLLRNEKITAQMLYGSYSYAIGYHPGIRLVAMGTASVWIIFFLILSNTILNHHIPILSQLGAHTLPIYLFHGFIVKLIGKYRVILTIPTALICTVIVIVLLGNPFTYKLFRRIKLL